MKLSPEARIKHYIEAKANKVLTVEDKTVIREVIDAILQTETYGDDKALAQQGLIELTFFNGLLTQMGGEVEEIKPWLYLLAMEQAFVLTELATMYKKHSREGEIYRMQRKAE